MIEKKEICKYWENPPEIKVSYEPLDGGNGYKRSVCSIIKSEFLTGQGNSNPSIKNNVLRCADRNLGVAPNRSLF